MNAARADLPTLTEVIEITSLDSGFGPTVPPLPQQAESVALEEGVDPVPPAPAAPALSPLQLRAEPLTPVSTSAAATLAYDEELVAQVMARLQPRLEAWVETQVRHALTDLLPVWMESAALSIARDLRTEMPELLSLALDEVHRQRRRHR